MKQKLNEALAPFGLDGEEILTYHKLLAYDHLTTTKLSLETKIPRTSLYLILDKLEKKELARQIRVGGHQEWQAASPEELLSKTSRAVEALKGLMPDLIQRQGYKSLHKLGTVEFTQGERSKTRAALRTIHNHLLDLPNHEHVYVIEGIASRDWKLGKFGTEYLRTWKRLLVDGKFILNGIFAESTVKEILSFETSTLEKLIARPLHVSTLRDSDLTFDSDILICKDRVIIAHPALNSAVVINYTHTALTFKKIFEALERSGQSIDLHKHIRAELLNRKKG